MNHPILLVSNNLCGTLGVAKGNFSSGFSVSGLLTALAEAYFFSVATIPPLRWAAFRADLPLTTVSRGPEAPPRTRLPILVTEFQSSDILIVGLVNKEVEVGISRATSGVGVGCQPLGFDVCSMVGEAAKDEKGEQESGIAELNNVDGCFAYVEAQSNVRTR